MDIIHKSSAGVLEIAFNRPDKKNAITAAMYSDLAAMLWRADEDTDVRVLVIKGSSAIFTAGADLEDFQENPPLGMDAPLYRFLGALSSFTKPIIASVSGPAIGIGMTMLLHCDLVYAADCARFALPFVQLGLCPEAASSLLLPRLLGHQRAAGMLLMGEQLMAPDALLLGLINRSVPAACLDDLVHGQATKLAGLPAASVRETKRLMKCSSADLVEAQIATEGQQFSALLAAPDSKEAFAAFLEKRRPVFR
jgi:enoyl-CoA hydratase/carnithine racemase